MYVLFVFEILQFILCRHFNQRNQIISLWVKKSRQRVRYHGDLNNSAQTQKKLEAFIYCTHILDTGFMFVRVIRNYNLTSIINTYTQFHSTTFRKPCITLKVNCKVHASVNFID